LQGSPSSIQYTYLQGSPSSIQYTYLQGSPSVVSSVLRSVETRTTVGLVRIRASTGRRRR